MQKTTLFTAWAFLCLVSHSVFADDGMTVWQPGNNYHTHITYTITVENAELEPGTNKCYHGRYTSPKLTFIPVVEFDTGDIVKAGKEYFAHRVYGKQYQAVYGLYGIKWKSDDWMINPRRWWRAVCRYHDQDIDSMRDLAKKQKDAEREQSRLKKDVERAEKEYDTVKNRLEKEKREDKAKKLQEDLAKASERLKVAREKLSSAGHFGLPCEQFDIFYDTQHNSTRFDPSTEKLFLKWDDASIKRYFSGKAKNAMSVRIGKMELTTEEALKRGWSSVFPKEANDAIRDTIASEFGVTASTIFDDPTGKLRLIENRKVWKIDAGSLNGLLATEELRNFICFKGTLSVERFPVRPTDCAGVGLSPFEGWKVKVVDSEGATIGYDTGEGYEPFPFTIAQDGENRIEFWFDSNNETLRYAKVLIRKEGYEGNIPNPNLGKMLSQLKGKARGNVLFQCEYTTSINQALRNL